MAEKEIKVVGWLPLLIVVAPWWVGLYVIVKATLDALF